MTEGIPCKRCGKTTDIDTHGEPFLLCQPCDLSGCSVGEDAGPLIVTQLLLDVVDAGLKAIHLADITEQARTMYDENDVQILANDIEEVEDGAWVGARVWVPAPA